MNTTRSGGSESPNNPSELHSLVNLFFDGADKLGGFALVSASEMPEVDQRLLAHNHHMTVTLESHHACPVDVTVLEIHKEDNYYSRKILLTRQSDDRVVQYGIVRLDLSVLAEKVQAEIVAQECPLGRILIEHNVLREVKLLNLFRIQPGEEMAQHLELDSGKVCYGRTALIYCDSQPAIELLEVVN